ncbi:alpha/beta hydrolase [uncultured Alistipes sp.]|uniref:alpha/beta hydrolase n=1 Tax=uncultured Alistipes sp. TaxID=538949 RepID=UPI0025CE9FC9|nr:alpha/beta hydrolase [uncultured Alistipes sp.]
MRRALLTVALAAGLVAGASAARAGQPETQRPETQRPETQRPEAARHSEPAAPRVLKIWDNASAPHSNGIATAETTPGAGLAGNTSEAVLYIYPADAARDTGLAAVVCPGGGYSCVALDHEGHAMGRWLASEGVTAAVLKYRLPEGCPEVPQEDAEQALRIMQGLEAGATGFTPDRVGIVGFSAGGHLAATVSTLGRTRPAFAVLFYPVIATDGAATHRGSIDRLLGPDPAPGLLARYSPDRQVDDATPPTLLLLSDDDRGVPPANSLRYYEALKARGIPASMHIYPSGGHGWGCGEGFAYRAQWQQALLDWLRQLRPADRETPAGKS